MKRPFFLQPILNRSILVKHNMRHGEESLDGTRRLNALKLIFPLDAANISFGARTILTSQCKLESLFERCFESDQTSTDRDLKLIGLLDNAPTLDPFLLQEILKQNGLDVAPCYLAANRHVLRHQTAIVNAEANPIVELFSASSPLLSSANEGYNSGHAMQTERLPNVHYVVDGNIERGQKLSECFSDWKVFLFYRLRLEELTSTTKHLLTSLERLRTNYGTPQTTPLIERRRRGIYDTLASALSEAQLIVDDYNLLHYAVLNGARPILFRSLLLQSKMYFTALGWRISRLDDALGFWSAHAPGAPDRVETYTLESFMESFDRHIASDLPLPKFAPVGPRLGLSDRATRMPVSSRLKSDLPG